MNNLLLDLAIEEFEVTTASRRSEKLTEVASAVFVITQDDIKRSGATNIPEALRMAPGMEVARIGANMGGIITLIKRWKKFKYCSHLECIQHAGFKLNTQLL
ncbi:TonB-dependent receptor plug domain-containing protein [Nitrosomonas sp. Nm84]|uniref:TonB-dependent receptor plug domain-containing protein n=1 Tax=Nitrosomonas sp. Nm84 TaxID=200124 RepID=UPI0021ACBE90|nr:TonB-dependent receptor plug domain-containing protein [Nitrosomonas sp. Nm84]